MSVNKGNILLNRVNLFIIILFISLIVALSFFTFFYVRKNKLDTYHNKARLQTKALLHLARQNEDIQDKELISKRKTKNNIHSYLKSLNNEGVSIWICNDKGKILQSSLPQKPTGSLDISDSLFNKLSKQKDKVFFTEFSLKDKPNILSQAYAGYIPEYSWIILSEVRTDQINTEIQSLLFYLLIFSGAGILLLLVCLTLNRRKSLFESKDLLETEKKYQTLFNAANDGIVIIEKYRFIDFNEKFLEIFQAEKADIIGSTPDQFSPETQPNGSNSYDKAIDIIDKCTEGSKQFFEWKHKRKDGEEFYAEVSVNKIEIENREMLLGIVRDITSRKTLEERLIKAKNRAEESDRLKSAFLANTSHEIRTPMNAIIGFSKLLQSEKTDDEKRKDYTDNIIEKGFQLLRIINDIIDVSKIEANQLNINKSSFSLNELMNEIYSEFAFKNQKDKNLSFYLSNEAKNSNYILLDQSRLKQILNNLLSNAFKYTDKGSVEFGYKLQDKETILFFVKDTGIGIDSNKQQIIFDTFRKSDTSATRLYGGTGLGLSISRALIELMGGKIWVRSDLNKGAEFYFTLPYEPAYKVDSEKVSEEEPSGYNWKEKNILIVEDDYLSYEYLKEILKEAEANIVWAKDGQSAIEKCKNNPEIDLVLMDIQLPGIDGNTATKEIRKFNNHLPIIAQTAYALEDEKKKILEAGCNDYLSKPINEKSLFEKIDYYLKIKVKNN